MFNRAGSSPQSLKSEKGQNFSEVSAPIYGVGKWAGAYIGNTSDRLDFDASLNFTNAKGTYEIMYMPTTGYNGTTQWIVSIFNNVSNGIHLSIVGIGASGCQWIYQRRPSPVTLAHVEPWTSFTIDAWHHMALVWDSAGIGGGSDTVRAYLNNVIVGSTTTSITVGNFSPTTNSVGAFPGTSATPMIGRVCNFKSYSEAVTDFSNSMNNEGFGGAKRRIG